MRWLTVVGAKQLVDTKGDPVSRRQLLRRLRAIDKRVGGKLLRWRGQEGRGGVLEINPAVLRQHLSADPIDPERELGHIHERISAIDRRVVSLRKSVKKHEKLLHAQNSINEGQSAWNRAMSGR